MRKSKVDKKILIILLIVLLLVLAVGYAVFSDTLTIQGTANSKGTFDLEFQNAEMVKSQGVNEEETTINISGNKNTLKVNVADLAYPGAGVEFSVDIVNVGTIPAKVQAVKQTNINGSGNIKVRGLEVINTDHPIIGAGDKCNIHFVVELSKDAIEIKENESINFELEIEYVQETGEVFTGNTAHIDGKIKEIPEYTIPTGIKAIYGQTLGDIELPEGFSFQDSLGTSVGEVGTNIFKVTYTPENTENYNIVTDIEITIKVGNPTLVSQITGSDYGKKINYSTTVQGETVDNWKIFLNDEQNVYIILDDYMPNRLLPAATGLQKSGTYVVYSSVNRETLLNRLVTETYWKEFAGGVEGALATGSPTNAQFIESWNANPQVNTRKIEEGKVYYYGSPNGVELSDSTKLYVPHTEMIDNCNAYWLASLGNSKANSLFSVLSSGAVSQDFYNNPHLGVRPVVKLPSNLTGKVGDIVEI